MMTVKELIKKYEEKQNQLIKEFRSDANTATKIKNTMYDMYEEFLKDLYSVYDLY